MASVASACWAATWPGQSADYWEVRSWLDAWHLDPYRVPSLDVDYPPQALVLLAPLKWLPANPALFAAINTGLCVAAAWLCVSVTAELARLSLSRLQTSVLVALTLACGAVRVAIWRGQTMALALVLLLLAVRYGRRRPWVAGACFGLGAFKLTMAAGFALALVLLGMSSIFPAAVATMTALTFAYALSHGRGIFPVMADYVQKLRSIYSGTDIVEGVSDLRPIAHDLLANNAVAVGVALAVALITLGALVVAARRAEPSPRTDSLCFAASLLWTLMNLFHQRYDFVLLMPAVFLLLWASASFSRMVTQASKQASKQAMDPRRPHRLSGHRRADRGQDDRDVRLRLRRQGDSLHQLPFTTAPAFDVHMGARRADPAGQVRRLARFAGACGALWTEVRAARPNVGARDRELRSTGRHTLLQTVLVA